MNRLLRFAFLSAATIPLGLLASEEKTGKDSGVHEEDAGPSATFSSPVMTLRPSGATFEIPKSWVTEYREHGKNAEAARRKFKSLKHGAGEWDYEYGEICNIVFAFEDCVVHAGGEAWGRDANSYGDVQMRAYVLKDSPKRIKEKVENAGVDKAKKFSKDVSLAHAEYKKWNRSSLKFKLFYTDYGGTAHVDVFTQSFGDQTVALVFMYVKSIFKEYEDVEKVVDSFEWKK